MNIKEQIAELYPQVVQWRRQIHMHPELGFEEYKTAQLVEQVLKAAGIEVTRYPDSTAVMGLLQGGKPGKTIALRADMDALPVDELADIEFASKVPGVMHACGHDVHTAILMGVATLLAQNKANVPGTVKFLFQPAEEKFPGGAKAMVANGVLENPKVEQAFGLHVYPNLPTEMVGLAYGYSSANTDAANIKVIGKGGHGAHPESTVDAVMVASHIAVALQTIISRNISASDSAVISVGSIHAGTVNNIIAETAELKLTIRSLKPETRQLLKQRIEEITQGVCLAMNAKSEIEYEFGYPSVKNDDDIVDLVKEVAVNIVGEDNIHVSTTPMMGGEDFSYFANEVPSAFFGLGAGFKDKVNYPNHNPKFEVNEECIKTGMEIIANLVVRGE